MMKDRRRKVCRFTQDKIEIVDYKDVELLKRLTNRQGKIISRRKSGCTAVSQHAVTKAIKRARFMALLPYTGE